MSCGKDSSPAINHQVNDSRESFNKSEEKPVMRIHSKILLDNSYANDSSLDQMPELQGSVNQADELSFGDVPNSRFKPTAPFNRDKISSTMHKQSNWVEKGV